MSEELVAPTDTARPAPPSPAVAVAVTPTAVTSAFAEPVLARRSPAAWVIMLTTLVVGVAVDLGSKYWAFRSIADAPVEFTREQVLAISAADPTKIGMLIPRHDAVVVMPRVLEFTLVLNPGAVFGMGAGQRGFFMAFTGLAVVACLLMFTRWLTAADRMAQAAIGLVIAGGLGNFYDRFFYACVRDFLHPLPGVKWPFGWKPFGGSGEIWPYVSNVADAFLLVGIAVLAVFLWRHEPRKA